MQKTHTGFNAKAFCNHKAEKVNPKNLEKILFRQLLPQPLVTTAQTKHMKVSVQTEKLGFSLP